MVEQDRVRMVTGDGKVVRFMTEGEFSKEYVMYNDRILRSAIL